ncbi:hypothetical protein ACJMK2_016462 [Sinanodonta woodiana]|uniref:non-specific serine/threonine protein kinase n=1 Tax=Sinanodonta woodiana TaxID=1069815 RepID=A0ABD3UTN5_SINWO
MANSYAMKVMDLRKSKAEERELALQEAEVLRKFSHPHVLHYVTSFEKDGLLCIVTEYCPNGDLSGYLEAQQDKVRLGNMGLTRVLERPNAKAVTFCGSPYYMSPEIFSCMPYDSKSDIWALGVIVYEMSTLERPFDAMLMQQLVFKIVHGSLPNMPTGYCKGLVDLIEAMLSKDPVNRPTAAEILENAIFKNMKPTKPPLLPKHQKDGAKNGGRGAWESIIMGKSAVEGRDSDFHIDNLLGTLSLEHKKRFKPKTEEKPRTSKYEDDDALATIAADKYRDAGNDKSKTVKSTRWNKTLTSSQVELEFTDEDKERTLKANQQTEAQAMDVLDLVIRTLTGIFPKGYPGGQPMDATRPHEKEAMLLKNIEQLQYYCMKVLDNDQAKFQKAYDILGAERKEDMLEERLIKLLGSETWALIGVQLMYLKNFEYNIHKLHQQRKPKQPTKTAKKGK